MLHCIAVLPTPLDLRTSLKRRDGSVAMSSPLADFARRRPPPPRLHTAVRHADAVHCLTRRSMHVDADSSGAAAAAAATATARSPGSGAAHGASVQAAVLAAESARASVLGNQLATVQRLAPGVLSSKQLTAGERWEESSKSQSEAGIPSFTPCACVPAPAFNSRLLRCRPCAPPSGAGSRGTRASVPVCESAGAAAAYGRGRGGLRWPGGHCFRCDSGIGCRGAGAGGAVRRNSKSACGEVDTVEREWMRSCP
jgi:hypothetical protein